MIAVVVGWMLAAAPIAVDVDASGLSPLERAAIEDRARGELGDVVPGPGLVACGEDARCRRAVLQAVGASAGAAVRVVKVLQVVRVDLAAIDGAGATKARSTKNLDVEAAARGPLFDTAVVAAVRVAAGQSPATSSSSAREPAPSTETPSSATPDVDAAPRSTSPAPPPAEDGSRIVGTAALVGIVGGAALALGASGVAAYETWVAYDARSLGGDKELARAVGPAAVALAIVGAAVAAAGGALLVVDGS